MGESPVLQDINVVLSTIPASNRVTNLFFDIKINGRYPFHACLDQDWAGLWDQIVRISNEKPLEVDLQTVVEGINSVPGEHVLYTRLSEKTAALSQFPQICTHFWSPDDWHRGRGPFPRDQVRSRCR